MATAAAVVAWVAWATWACKAKPYLDHRFLTLGSGRRSPAEMPGFFLWVAGANYLELSWKR